MGVDQSPAPQPRKIFYEFRKLFYIKRLTNYENSGIISA